MSTGSGSKGLFSIAFGDTPGGSSNYTIGKLENARGLHGRPDDSEFAPFYAGYVGHVPETNKLPFSRFDRTPLPAFDENSYVENARNGKSVTVRALAFIMAGHVRHHLKVLETRYGVNPEP